MLGLGRLNHRGGTGSEVEKLEWNMSIDFFSGLCVGSDDTACSEMIENCFLNFLISKTRKGSPHLFILLPISILCRSYIIVLADRRWYFIIQRKITIKGNAVEFRKFSRVGLFIIFLINCYMTKIFALRTHADKFQVWLPIWNMILSFIKYFQFFQWSSGIEVSSKLRKNLRWMPPLFQEFIH